MKLIKVGKVVNFFGIKGELKIVNHFEMPQKIYIKGNTLIINEEKFAITNVRVHKNNYLIELNNIKDINKIEYLIGYDVYFDKDLLNLNDEEYLISDLLGYDIIENNTIIGIITSYDNNKINPLIKVNNSFIIPLKGKYINKIDKENHKVYVTDVKGLML